MKKLPQETKLLLVRKAEESDIYLGQSLKFISDVCYWKRDWMYKVLNKIKKYPENTFIFLSKNQHSYSNILFPDNCLKGFTITDNKNTIPTLAIDFISIEPILERIKLDGFHKNLKWIITGAETGNRKNKVIPKKEWIIDIKDYCSKNNIPLFMKESLKELMCNDFIQEFPEVKK